MVGFGDITGKAQQFLKDPKVKEALTGEKAEEVSDKILDAAAATADKVSGGKHSEAIKKARDSADKAVGDK